MVETLCQTGLYECNVGVVVLNDLDRIFVTAVKEGERVTHARDEFTSATHSQRYHHALRVNPIHQRDGGGVSAHSVDLSEYVPMTEVISVSIKDVRMM